METTNSWYNKTTVVVLLLIFIFPIGLYALWKNENSSKILKIGVTLFFVFVCILAANTETPPVELDIQKEKKSQLNTIAYRAEQNIIDNLKDPSSFELIEKDYKFLNDTIYQVKIRYSATNSFNARVQNQYIRSGVLKYNPADTSFTDIIKFEE